MEIDHAKMSRALGGLPNGVLNYLIDLGIELRSCSSFCLQETGKYPAQIGIEDELEYMDRELRRMVRGPKNQEERRMVMITYREEIGRYIKEDFSKNGQKTA